MQKAGRLNITDLMNIGIFFVINLVVKVVIAFIGITPITYVMITSVQALILGIPMMLFLAKVHKPGMVFIFLLLSGLASLLLGLGIWPLLLSLVMAVFAELILRYKYTSAIHSVIAYAFIAVSPTASYIPLFFTTRRYIESSGMQTKYGASFADGLTSIGQMTWLFLIIVIVTFVCGILGGILGLAQHLHQALPASRNRLMSPTLPGSGTHTAGLHLDPRTTVLVILVVSSVLISPAGSSGALGSTARWMPHCRSGALFLASGMVALHCDTHSPSRCSLAFLRWWYRPCPSATSS